jgi:hypothetical protein
LTGPLCPISYQGSPAALLKLQMAPGLKLLISSGSKNKDPIRQEKLTFNSSCDTGRFHSHSQADRPFNGVLPTADLLT